MRAFHSSENDPSFLCCTSFLVEGKRQAGSSHLNEKFSIELDTTVLSYMYFVYVCKHPLVVMVHYSRPKEVKIAGTMCKDEIVISWKITSHRTKSRCAEFQRRQKDFCESVRFFREKRARHGRQCGCIRSGNRWMETSTTKILI